MSDVGRRADVRLPSLRAIGGELTTAQAPSIERSRQLSEQILADVRRLDQNCTPPVAQAA
jgi:hypothetical protein